MQYRTVVPIVVCLCVRRPPAKDNLYLQHTSNQNARTLSSPSFSIPVPLPRTLSHTLSPCLLSFPCLLVALLLLQAKYVLRAANQQPKTPEEVAHLIHTTTTSRGAASISAANARTPSTTEVPASNRNYVLAR